MWARMNLVLPSIPFSRAPNRGPVAQLGARFHGMEEVVGSIPTRSTIFSSTYGCPGFQFGVICCQNAPTSSDLRSDQPQIECLLRAGKRTPCPLHRKESPCPKHLCKILQTSSCPQPET